MTWQWRYPLAGAVVVAALVAGSGGAQQNTPLGRGYDVDQPIEISSDSLEVRQKENLAIFQGNVAAIQGDIRLRADRVTVHYRRQGANDSAGSISGTIAKLDAVGNVFVSSPTETARGKSAVYDVDNRTVSLRGSVVLTRGENVLRGERLVINLATGVTKLDGGAAGQAGQAGPTGRVQGIFHPERKTQQKQ